MSKSLSSRRAAAREAAKKRRAEKRDWRLRLLDLVAAGHAYDVIAAKAGVAVSTVRRQVARAIAQRPPEPAEIFVALQRERLNKALKCADIALDNGDLRAIAALIALMPQVERYWGLQNALAASRPGAESAPVLAPNPMKSLEVESAFPPLAGEPARVGE